jgi:hypothetical protein
MPECRECGCPDWVLQCAHFDGRWVLLHKSWAGGYFVACSGHGEVQHTTYSYVHEYEDDPMSDDILLDYDTALARFNALHERMLAHA